MGNIPIEISEMTDDLAELESTIIAIREGIETTSQKDRVNEILEKYGNPRSAIPSLILLEETAECVRMLLIKEITYHFNNRAIR